MMSGASQKLRHRGINSILSDEDVLDEDEGKFSKTLKRYDAYAKVRHLNL